MACSRSKGGCILDRETAAHASLICEEQLGWTAREGGAGGLVKGGELTADGQRHMEAIKQRLLSSSSVGMIRSF